MIFILIVLGAFISYFLFNMIKDSFIGKNYWAKCERDYYNLIKMGYDKRAALIEVSKKKSSRIK